MNYCLIAAFTLDALVDEPPRRWHPVCWMGSAVAKAESMLLDDRKGWRLQKLEGAVVAASLPLATWWLSRRLLGRLPRPLSALTGTALTAVALARSSLSQGARDVEAGLATGSESGTERGRNRVASLVGRDTEYMDEEEIVRATVESVAENANDGVVAPLFYAWAGGAPLALAYKMVNTLDSMIGYPDERYLHFGWAAARLDDLAGYIPARLTAAAAVAAAPVVGGSPIRAARVWRQDAPGHSSPNAGVAEASFAGALGVRLGGRDYYQGRAVDRQVMGGQSRLPRREDISRAVLLMNAVAILLVLIGALLPLSRTGRRRRAGFASGWREQAGEVGQFERQS